MYLPRWRLIAKRGHVVFRPLHYYFKSIVPHATERLYFHSLRSRVLGLLSLTKKLEKTQKLFLAASSRDGLA